MRTEQIEIELREAIEAAFIKAFVLASNARQSDARYHASKVFPFADADDVAEARDLGTSASWAWNLEHAYSVRYNVGQFFKKCPGGCAAYNNLTLTEAREILAEKGNDELSIWFRDDKRGLEWFEDTKAEDLPEEE
jgi:hypothetical protein